MQEFEQQKSGSWKPWNYTINCCQGEIYILDKYIGRMSTLITMFIIMFIYAIIIQKLKQHNCNIIYIISAGNLSNPSIRDKICVFDHQMTGIRLGHTGGNWPSEGQVNIVVLWVLLPPTAQYLIVVFSHEAGRDVDTNVLDRGITGV